MLFRYFGELSSVIVDVFLMIRLDQSPQCCSGHISVWPIIMTATGRLTMLACLLSFCQSWSFCTLGNKLQHNIHERSGDLSDIPLRAKPLKNHLKFLQRRLFIITYLQHCGAICLSAYFIFRVIIQFYSFHSRSHFARLCYQKLFLLCLVTVLCCCLRG